MKELTTKLPIERFKRIHRSFIVALDKILSIQQNGLKIADETLPVGASYKKDLLAAIKVL